MPTYGTAHPAPTAIGHPAYSQTLPCEPQSARRARLLVGAACNAWGLPGLTDAASLVVSELVGNAVEHSGSRLVRVIVSLPEPGRVKVAVVDRSRIAPAPRPVTDTDEDGRGLVVVQTLSDRWGTDLMRWGKRIWAELGTDPGGGA
ncbi:ATP-binding protein [Streptomyces sp. NPDC088554]|uniref:ATP-binding protein n=1 Tax=Streptomyces sp. NPDC088554 TaxID=3365865 RepID=UPI003817E9C2